MRWLFAALLILVAAIAAQGELITHSVGGGSVIAGVTPVTCSSGTAGVLFQSSGKVGCDSGFTYAGANGAVSIARIGTNAAPSLLFTGGGASTNTGFAGTVTPSITVGVNGNLVADFASATISLYQKIDLAGGGPYIQYGGSQNPATIRFGLADAATSVPQTFRTQGIVAGTAGNVAGSNFTLAVSPGVGSGGGGSFIVQTAPPHGSDTVQDTLTSVFSINSAGNMAATLNAAVGTNAVCNTPGTLTGVTVQVWATGCAASSARFKEGIAVIDRERAFETVLALRPVSYFYRPDYADDPDKHIGFTAEQVNSLPSPVDGYSLTTTEKDSDLLHGFKYNEMAPLLVAAIQQLKADNDNLRVELEALKRKVQ